MFTKIFAETLANGKIVYKFKKFFHKYNPSHLIVNIASWLLIVFINWIKQGDFVNVHGRSHIHIDCNISFSYNPGPVL